MRSGLSISAFAVALAHLTTTDAVATSDCGNPVAACLTRGGSDKTNTVQFTTSSGVVRSYRLHIPTAYDDNTPAPLAFSFHGRGETASGQESISQMSNETLNANYIVVYPTGINLEWQGDPDATTDDVSFTLELVANLSSTYCLDSDRIFSAGKSNGGGFSANVLACDPVASRTIAAFAGMSGAMYQNTASGNTDVGCVADAVEITCNPGRSPVPVLETHASADNTINYFGGARRGKCLPTIPRWMTDKGQRAGVRSMNTSTSLYNGNVIQYTYGNNASLNGVVTHYWSYNMDHIWPSVAAGTWFDATPIMWDFFNKWRLDNTPYTYINVTISSSVASATATSTAITGSAAPTTSVLSCPASNGQVFTASNGATFLLDCGIDPSGGDLSMVYVSSYEACINTCATTTGCVGVSLSGQACYMKKSVGSSITNSGIRGAELIAASGASSSSTVLPTVSSVSGALSSSSAVVSSSASSSSSGSSSLASSSAISSSSSFSTSTASTLSTIITSTVSSSATGSVGLDGYTTTTFPPTCTAINTNIYAVTDSSGLPYLYMCGGGSAGTTINTITNVANWTACEYVPFS